MSRRFRRPPNGRFRPEIRSAVDEYLTQCERDGVEPTREGMRSFVESRCVGSGILAILAIAALQALISELIKWYFKDK